MIAKRLQNRNKSIIRQIADSAPANSINLGLGEIQFKTPNFLRLKAKQIINQGELFYTPNAGILELREAIADYYNKIIENPQTINPQQICVTNGAQEAIFAVLFALCDPDDTIMIPDPCFLAYKTIAEMLNARVISFKCLPDQQFEIDWDDFEQKISQKPKILQINHPCNPTGKAFTKTEMLRITDYCKKYNTLLVVDEVYKDVWLNEEIPSFTGLYDQTVIISGLSKSFCMTGWRIGWILAQPELIQAFIVAHQYISTCASVISQKTAVKAFSPQADIQLKKLRKMLKVNHQVTKEMLLKKVNENDIIVSDAAPYVFVNIHRDDLDFCKLLAEKGLIVIPGSAFGQQSKGFIRISYALNQKKLKTGLNKLLKYL